MSVCEDQGKLFMKVKRAPDRLYKIIMKTCKPVCLLSKMNEMAWLWHSKLGHVNFQAIGLMSKDEMVPGFSKIIQPKGVCNGCLMAKKTRKPMPA